MKKYIVKREYREAWNTENDVNNEAEWIVTDEEISRLAGDWGKNKSELMEQVQEA